MDKVKQSATHPYLNVQTSKKKYSYKEAINYLQKYQEAQNISLKPDCWVFNPPGSEVVDFSYTPKKVLLDKPSPMKNWLALTPGDIIYYYGAFGVKAAIHWGVYIGNGYVFEKWRGLKNPKNNKN